MDAIKQAKYDACVVRLYSIFLVLHMTNNSIKQVLNIAPEAGGKISVIVGLVFACFFVREFKNMNPNLFVRLVVWEMLFLSLYVISILRYPEAQSAILSRGIWTFVFCIPFASLAYGMRNSCRFISKPMTIAMLIMFVEGIYVFYHNGIVGVVANVEYNMAFGYMLLLPTLYFIYQGCFNKWFLFLAGILLLLIFLYASRGPLLFIVLFVFLFFIGRQKGVNKFLLILGIVFVCCFIYITFDTIVSGLVYFADELGLHSRTLNKMLQGDEALTNLSGRDIIWQETQNNIMKKPWLGWGIAGELSYMVSYPHNFILEVVLHYGIIVGPIIVLFVLGNICKGLILTRMRNPIMLMFFCSGLCPLFLSGTYLVDTQLWMLAALCLRPKQDYIPYFSYIAK